MSWNPHKRWLNLIPHTRLDAGQVIEVTADGATIQLPTGEQVRVRGQASVGEQVYIRGGVIEGPAPGLTGIDQEV